jgi:hypothetical protein
VGCHVLERPGFDAIWVQTEPTFAIRRRQFHWSQSGALRQDATFTEMQEVAPKVWLPRSIKYDYYTAPWDDRPIHGRIAARLLLKVSNIEVTKLPDSTFRAAIPEGAIVTEVISSERGTQFVNQPGMDPFQEAASKVKPVRRSYWTLILAVLILVSVSAGLILWQRRRVRAKA